MLLDGKVSTLVKERSVVVVVVSSLEEIDLVRGNGKGIDEERVREKGGKLIRVKGRKSRTSGAR